MARIVKDYDERYTEFLDAAQTLFFSQGYESTSVQDIIKTVGVAKGTFYHYFDSKAEILNTLVKRMFEQTLAALEPMVADETLNAVQKLEQFFVQIHQWKIANKAFMLDTARMLYQDENVLLREKMREEGTKSAIPVLAEILRQGVAEEVFDVDYPYETAELTLVIISALSQALILLILTGQHEEDIIERVRRHIAVFNRSIGRILGMSDSKLELLSADDVNAWL